MRVLRNRDIKVLQRRVKFLTRRIENASEFYPAGNYDAMECEALKRAVDILNYVYEHEEIREQICGKKRRKLTDEDKLIRAINEGED